MGDQEKGSTKRERNIHLVEDRYSFVKKEWKVQRVLEIFMFLFLIGGFLGLFGGGWLSKKIISSEAFTIEYYQYLRVKTPTELSVYLDNPPDTTVISFNNTYLEEVRIEQIAPQPIAARTENGRQFYVFNTASAGLIIFYMFPEHAGSVKLHLQVNDNVKYLEQYVYF